jgi:hypothetical protein
MTKARWLPSGPSAVDCPGAPGLAAEHEHKRQHAQLGRARDPELSDRAALTRFLAMQVPADMADWLDLVAIGALLAFI